MCWNKIHNDLSSVDSVFFRQNENITILFIRVSLQRTRTTVTFDASKSTYPSLSKEKEVNKLEWRNNASLMNTSL